MEPLQPLAGGGGGDTQVNAMQRVARAKRCHLTSTSPRAAKEKKSKQKKKIPAKGSKTRKEGDCGEEAWPTRRLRSRLRASERATPAVLLFLSEGGRQGEAVASAASSPFTRMCVRARARVLLVEPVVRETCREEPGGGGRREGAGRVRSIAE